jgi:hypothetical protein
MLVLINILYNMLVLWVIVVNTAATLHIYEFMKRCYEWVNAIHEMAQTELHFPFVFYGSRFHSSSSDAETMTKAPSYDGRVLCVVK